MESGSAATGALAGFIDKGEEAYLNALAELAARSLEVQGALITVLDGEHLWFKARCGIEGEGAPLANSLAERVICLQQTVVIPDLTAEETFPAEVHAYRELGMRFYAGTPIRGPVGLRGTLCLFDSEPRHDWSERRKEVLERIARLVEMHLHFRHALRERAGLQPGQGTRISSIIEEIGRLADDLTYQANHDILTGLLNRRGFEKEVARHVANPYSGSEYSLLYLDLDQFKLVNDVCGHPVGDLLLQRFAAVFQVATPDDALMARLGDDEFAVLIPDEDGLTGEAVAEEVISRCKEVRFMHGARVFGIASSIGVVRPVSTYRTFQALLIAADSACHMAKERGGNRVVAYDPEDPHFQEQQERMESASRVRERLDDGHFALYRQRIAPVDPEDPEVKPYYEVLLRLPMDDGGVAGPGAVIPAAERFGLIAELDQWVLGTVLEALREDDGEERYAINFSGQSLTRPGFGELVLNMIHGSGVDPRRLIVEITETAAIDQLERVIDLIDGLQNLGASVALDDFGSGFSSFGYLRRLHVNCVKIDGQFVRNVHTDPLNQRIVESICGINGELGVYAVAEFVESEAVLPTLKSLGVRYAQGYAVHRPEPWVVGQPKKA